MDSSIFSVSRDLLYLSGALTGIALGFVLSLLRKDLGIRSKNRRISVMLLFLSGALAAFAAALGVSRGAVFSDSGLFLAAGMCIPPCALAARFPRAAAYPLILAGGLLAVWLAFSYLRFPPADSGSAPPALIYGEGEGPFSIQTGGGRAPVLSIPDGLSSLEFRGVLISFDRHYPFVGGAGRGRISEIRRNGEVLYHDAGIGSPLLEACYSWLGANAENGSFGIRFQVMRAHVPFETIPRAGNIAVLFDRDTLLFAPSWQ
ncbi:MAG: hypothetical protein LBP27_02575 [Treponema sp.]|jgi:hypothetical protein|nr:hypothetical protein [Treponema sp.]